MNPFDSVRADRLLGFLDALGDLLGCFDVIDLDVVVEAAVGDLTTIEP